MGNYVRKLNERLNIIDKSRYNREQYQSYMTSPEWFNVEISENFANFLREGKSMFRFPYFSQLSELWRVLYKSYSAARKYNSAYQILTSDYMVMDLFVALFTTAELLPKGILSLLLYPFLPKDNHTPMQAHLADYFSFYATDIETKPFFEHDYKKYHQELTDKFNACESRTWIDWFTWSCVSVELKAKGWISGPLKNMFHNEESVEPSTTDILVKFDAQGIDDPEQAKALFKSKLAEINPEFDIHVIDEHVYAKDKKAEKNYTSVYARLTAPRYMPFRAAVHELETKAIRIRKIAGQDHVQVKCDLIASDEPTLKRHQDALNRTKNATPLYAYRDSIHTNRRICLFDVPVANLHKTLNRLEKQEGTTIKFIHNF